MVADSLTLAALIFVLFVFERPCCASAAPAAPTARALITAPKTVGFILPPEMNSHQEAHQFRGHGRGARSSRQPRASRGNLDPIDGVGACSVAEQQTRIC